MDAIERRARHAARANEWYYRNREKVLESQRAARAADPEGYRARRRARQAITQPWKTRAHKASAFAHAATRRAVTSGVEGQLTATDVRTIDGPCAYCGIETIGWDHVVPMVKGGPNTIANLVSCCPPCNWRKHHRTPDEAGMPLRVAL